MNKETLQKFYPVIIGLGLLVPVVTIYLTFFAGSSGENRTPGHDPNPPPPAASKRGGLDFPPKDGSTMLDGKSVPLQTLRDMVASGSSDQQQLVKAINALGDARDIYAAPQLLKLLDSKDEYLRSRAGVAMKKILGGDLNYSANMPEADRKKIIEAMRQQSQQIIAKLDKLGGAKN